MWNRNRIKWIYWGWKALLYYYWLLYIIIILHLSTIQCLKNIVKRLTSVRYSKKYYVKENIIISWELEKYPTVFTIGVMRSIVKTHSQCSQVGAWQSNKQSMNSFHWKTSKLLFDWMKCQWLRVWRLYRMRYHRNIYSFCDIGWIVKTDRFHLNCEI